MEIQDSVLATSWSWWDPEAYSAFALECWDIAHALQICSSSGRSGRDICLCTQPDQNGKTLGSCWKLSSQEAQFSSLRISKTNASGRSRLGLAWRGRLRRAWALSGSEHRRVPQGKACGSGRWSGSGEFTTLPWWKSHPVRWSTWNCGSLSRSRRLQLAHSRWWRIREPLSLKSKARDPSSSSNWSTFWHTSDQASWFQSCFLGW